MELKQYTRKYLSGIKEDYSKGIKQQERKTQRKQ